MPAISFAPSPFSSYTPVSDTFLTQYMPSANGTYVKVYLYFLHCSLHSDAKLTTAAAASTLHMIVRCAGSAAAANGGPYRHHFTRQRQG